MSTGNQCILRRSPRAVVIGGQDRARDGLAARHSVHVEVARGDGETSEDGVLFVFYIRLIFRISCFILY